MKKIAFLPIAFLATVLLWLVNACTTIEKDKKGDINFGLPNSQKTIK